MVPGRAAGARARLAADLCADSEFLQAARSWAARCRVPPGLPRTSPTATIIVRRVCASPAASRCDSPTRRQSVPGHGGPGRPRGSMVSSEASIRVRPHNVNLYELGAEELDQGAWHQASAAIPERGDRCACRGRGRHEGGIGADLAREFVRLKRMEWIGVLAPCSEWESRRYLRIF